MKFNHIKQYRITSLSRMKHLPPNSFSSYSETCEFIGLTFPGRDIFDDGNSILYRLRKFETKKFASGFKNYSLS